MVVKCCTDGTCRKCAHITPLLRACENGTAAEVEALLNDVDLFDVEVSLALVRASRGDRADVIELLDETFVLTKKHGCAGHNLALREACSRGHWSALRALHRIFRYTAADVRADGNAVLQDACIGEQVAVATWLVTTFGLTKADTQVADEDAPHGVYNIIFHQAWQAHNVRVLFWLHEWFGLTPEDIGAYNNMALRGACSHGQLEMAQYLRALAPAQAKAPDGARGRLVAFVHACAGGHWQTARWMYNDANLVTRRQIQSARKVLGRRVSDPTTRAWLAGLFK